ncbi:MAG TPA: AsmA-like C-terminal region-containing protein, partial [Lacipirellula sp.]
QLYASGGWRFAAGRPPAFRIGVRSARLEQLAAFAGDPDESELAGIVDVEFTVHPGRVWRIGGTIATGQGELSGVRFSGARLPIDADWHPRSGRLRIRIPTVSISLAGGRLTGRLTAQRSAGWMLDGSFRFYRVDFVTLVRQFGSASQYGSGRLTGTLTLTGRNMRSINDLQGALVADLEDTQAASLPVLSDLRGIIPGFSSGATRFQEGRIEARLARGVVTVQQLTLASSQLDIYITGTANLSGRLNLEAVVYTGQQENPLLANYLLERLAAVAAPPVALLAEANELLANRVIRLQITGTINRPVIRVRPLEMLREEVIRYFLRRAAGAVIGNVAPIPALADEDRD